MKMRRYFRGGNLRGSRRRVSLGPVQVTELVVFLLLVLNGLLGFAWCNNAIKDR